MNGKIFINLVGLAVALSQLAATCVHAGEKPILLRAGDLTVEFSSDGKIIAIQNNKSGLRKAVQAYTEIQGFLFVENRSYPSADKHSVRFEHRLYSDSLQQSGMLTETFTSKAGGIHWQLAIRGTAASWSSIIKTVIRYPATKESRFWTSWGEPQFDSSLCDPALVASLSPYKNSPGTKGWLDPLVPMPFASRTLYYGAPPFENADQKPGFIPFQGNLFAIPFASVFEKDKSGGFSVFLSPDDEIISLLMKTGSDGTIEFHRLFNRVNSSHELRFSLDLAVHVNEWRSSLGWFAKKYPDYINPVNPAAARLGGTAAYSNFFEEFDAEKMKRMSFTVNWQASFDFPYMGMFLPPLKRAQPWNRLGGGSMTIQKMDDYAARIRRQGFYVMSYFNVTEFGSWFKYPAPPTILAAADLWQDGSNFLWKNFPKALLRKTGRTASISSDSSASLYYSWKDAVATDCGDPAYQAFLLNQAQRHITELPNSFGICIDRLDWLRFFNEEADDGISWFNNKPSRSLVSSWKELMKKLGPLMHNNGKSILVNNHYKRVDLLKHADGILDEFTQAGSPLNTTAFLTLNKPALGWTPGKEDIEFVGGDNFFQKYLYLGVFPMCPFPGNDHALQPDSMVDRLYLDYGPLMNQLKEKQWVLKPGVVSVVGNKAKVNLFKTSIGYSIPVVYGASKSVTVILNEKKFLTSRWNYEAWLPGLEDPVDIQHLVQGGKIRLTVPLKRGVAMVTITPKSAGSRIFNPH